MKEYHYQDYPVLLDIFISGENLTRYLSEISSLNQTLDYPDMSKYEVGETSFILNDDEGIFSPSNDSNFFVDNGFNKNGYRAPVEIKSGFLVNGVRRLETIFIGNIIRINQGSKSATVEITSVDKLQPIRVDKVVDFGIPRRFMILHNPLPKTSNGEYPILKAVLPASNESALLHTRNNQIGRPPVERIKTEGDLNPLNYQFTDEGIETEGGIIQNRGIGYPQIQMKSPFRYKNVKDLVKLILEEYDITDQSKYDIDILEKEVETYFSSNGRPGYDIIGTQPLGTSNPVGWLGHVTDIIYDNNKYYFLYNVKQLYPSMIIEYDKLTGISSVVHKGSAGDEYWKLNKSGSNFAIMASNGVYDSSDSMSNTRILLYNNVSDTVTDLVPSSASLKPQLAHLYLLGKSDFEDFVGGGEYFLPDTRRSMIYHNGELYYAYVSSNQCGIAKATTQSVRSSVISWNSDGNGNHAGTSFDIKNGVLGGFTSFNNKPNSRISAFRKAL